MRNGYARYWAMTALVGYAMQFPLSADAETSRNIQVTATITAGCQINHGASTNAGTLGNLDFGEHPATSTALLTSSLVPEGGLNLSCTPGVALRMAVDGGQYFAGATRNLGLGAGRLPYRLYFNASFASEIPVGEERNVAYSNPDDIRLPMVARLQLPGPSPAGTYQDVLTVTLSW